MAAHRLQAVVTCDTLVSLQRREKLNAGVGPVDHRHDSA
jgi:hypothetical protein